VSVQLGEGYIASSPKEKIDQISRVVSDRLVGGVIGK